MSCEMIIKKIKETLDLYGFHRTIMEQWVEPCMRDDTDDNSPGGWYPVAIVPKHHIGKTLYLIDNNFFEQFFEGIISEFELKDDVE